MAGIKDSIFRAIARVARNDAAEAKKRRNVDEQVRLLQVADSWERRANEVEREKLGDRLPVLVPAWGYLKRD